MREDARSRASIGAPLEATDPDGGVPVYSLTVAGFTNPPFTIGRMSGQIQVAEGATLNHEDRDTYNVTATVTDDFDATDTESITISVTDVNEAPTAVSDRIEIDEDAPATALHVVLNDTDVDFGDVPTVAKLVRRPDPKKGSATVDVPSNTIVYTPVANFHGRTASAMSSPTLACPHSHRTKPR